VSVRQVMGPGPCEAKVCQRELQGGDRGIDEGELVRIEDKNYHKGCEPTLEERAAKNRA